MNSLKSITRYKTISRTAAVVSFLSIILLLLSGFLPYEILSIPTPYIVSGLTYIFGGGIVVSAYCYYRYDISLHSLDLTDKDIASESEEEKGRSLEAQKKRDRARKNRKNRKKRNQKK
jgi:hypothetical protein